MNTKPHILITNDDGINTVGIKYLWQSIYKYANTTIVAPFSQKSGASLSMTLTQPLHIKQLTWEENTPAWAISGTTTDCVKMALSTILSKPPDMIVSGINEGSNSGRSVLYSGTIGGIIEGTFRNIPGIAFSAEDLHSPLLHQEFEKYIYPLICHFLKHPLTPGTFINVTFPSIFPRGIKMARQGKGYWIDNPDKRLHPEGEPYYWLGIKWKEVNEEEESDVYLLQQGYITVVPIHVEELTDHIFLEKHKDILENTFIDIDSQNLI